VFKQVVVALWVMLAALPIMIITITALTPSAKPPSPERNQQQDIQAANKYLAQGLAQWHQQHYALALQDISLAAELGASDAKLYQHYGQGWLTAQQAKHKQTLPKEIWAPKACLQQILLVSAVISG
jgi:hypothetical protein